MSGLKKGAITLVGAVAATCAFMGPATSIYFNTGMGVQNAGNAFGFAFLVAMVAMLFVAYVIAQFAKKLPSSGFAYTFSVNGLGAKPGFLTGWLLVGGYAMLAPMLLSAIGYFLHLFFSTYFHINISWGIFSIIVGAIVLILSCMGCHAIDSRRLGHVDYRSGRHGRFFHHGIRPRWFRRCDVSCI
ncbi:amino acid permease [Alicyclobacillus dauci]|uniref:Amino acid permease n=1 Tax=Alicyclobacillus dauci TaxID=1475485 RepID=A0ABY6Z7K1_9BACL|nr:amino acid permease [Alicyclobacillus dauci]WAH38725.1 amino acid permease [Alicyclobacillus dauci]